MCVSYVATGKFNLSLPCFSIQIKNKFCKTLTPVQHQCGQRHYKVPIESFHLSGHTFRFHWSDQDLKVLRQLCEATKIFLNFVSIFFLLLHSVLLLLLLFLCSFSFSIFVDSSASSSTKRLAPVLEMLTVWKRAWKWNSWSLIWEQNGTDVSFISHIHVRFLSSVISFIVLPTLPSPPSAVLLKPRPNE